MSLCSRRMYGISSTEGGRGTGIEEDVEKMGGRPPRRLLWKIVPDELKV